MGKSVLNQIARTRDINTRQDELLRLSHIQGVLDQGAGPHVFNAMCALFVVVLAWADHGIDLVNATGWVTTTLALIVLRLIHLRWVRDRMQTGVKTRQVLRWMVLQALVGGFVWAALPFSLDAVDIQGAHAYLLVVMFGVVAGTLIRGVPHSGMAICFSLPPVLAALILIGAAPSAQTVLIYPAVLFFGVMMIRAARASEASFLRAAESKLEADTLSLSLKAAADDLENNSMRLQDLAKRDSLTGLASREHFAEELKDYIRTNRPFSLILLDLNRFRSVNDQFGHAAGDRLLIEVGDRLVAAVGEDGLVARLGSDEFAIFCPRADAESATKTFAARALAALQRPVMLTEKPYVPSASLGIVGFPVHAETISDLFAAANIALLDAKSRGGSQNAATTFSRELRLKAERQRLIERDLPDAIRTGSVTAWFQPQLWLSDLKLAGLESLMRWDHPQLGFISPEEIVQAAEKVQVLPQLTGMITEHACEMTTRLDAIGLSDVTVAINVSPREFGIYPVADMICAIASRHKISPQRLEIEFTEETLLEAGLFGDELRTLEQAGFRLAVDDFGMGHSSLTYLMAMKVDRLKIDRSFVQDLATSANNQALITAIVGLGHLLNIPVVVEGVEHDGDVDILRLLGCQTGQGYAFGRPMSADLLLDWIAARDEFALYEGLSAAG